MTDSGTYERSRAAEAFVARHLEGEGFEILESNYRTRYGEIDLIARSGGLLVFVEVKLIGRGKSTFPASKVDGRKRKRIADSAAVYLSEESPGFDTARFDVALVEDSAGSSDSTGPPYAMIAYLEAAFRPQGFYSI